MRGWPSLHEEWLPRYVRICRHSGSAVRSGYGLPESEVRRRRSHHAWPPMHRWAARPELSHDRAMSARPALRHGRFGRSLRRRDRWRPVSRCEPMLERLVPAAARASRIPVSSRCSRFFGLRAERSLHRRKLLSELRPERRGCARRRAGMRPARAVVGGFSPAPAEVNSAGPHPRVWGPGPETSSAAAGRVV